MLRLESKKSVRNFRRYARTDELGIPFAVTIDLDTMTNNTVTIRELASMEQIRMLIDCVATEVRRLVNRRSDWEELKKKYP